MGILAPRPGIELTPPALEGKVLTTGLPGKSPLILWVWLILIFPVSRIMQYLSFCDWLFSLSIMLSRFIYAVRYCTYTSFLRLNSIPLSVYTTFSSSVYRWAFTWLPHISCYGLCWNEHGDADISSRSCFNSLGQRPRIGIAGSRGHSILNLLRKLHCSSWQLCILPSHQLCTRAPASPQPHQYLPLKKIIIASWQVWGGISWWFWFAFCWWLVMLSILSYACWLSLCLIQRNVCSNPLPLFNQVIGVSAVEL